MLFLIKTENLNYLWIQLCDNLSQLNYIFNINFKVWENVKLFFKGLDKYNILLNIKCDVGTTLNIYIMHLNSIHLGFTYKFKI